VVDDFGKCRAKAYQIGVAQLALEHGILQVIAPPAHLLKDLPEALIIADVVADKIGIAHE
jgi:hypothetical protein